MSLSHRKAVVAPIDFAKVHERASGDVVPELEELRQKTRASAVLVSSGATDRKGRLLAVSLNGPFPLDPSLLDEAGGAFHLERAGCRFTFVRPPFATTRSRASALEPDDAALEPLVARVLGRIILQTPGAVVYQVSESQSRCLALASPLSLTILKEAASIACSDRPALIVGPSGAGKELLARYIHAASGRKKFVAISMAQMRGETAISELFGHVAGAFTGALSKRSGAFLETGDGTLFLDEISEMPTAAAALLLRAIEERRIKPLGSDRELEAPARILAATNRPGELRDDLFYRFLHRISLPPLRERPEDIRAIARFIGFREGFDISEKALVGLQVISAWNGNARELECFLLDAKRQSSKNCLGIQDVLRAFTTSSRVLLPRDRERSRLREIREGLDLSLRDFSLWLGVPKSTLEDIEKGRSPSRESALLQKVAKRLEKSLAEGESFQHPRTSKVKEELKRFLKEE